MLQYDTRNDLLQGTFVIDLQEICLTQLHVDSPITFRGPGTISQTKDGELHLKLLTNHRTNFGILLDHRRPENTPGMVIPPSSFYQMEAKEYCGTAWHCGALRISPPRYVDDGHVTGTVTANLANIEFRTGPRITGIHEFRGVIPGKLDIPYDKDAFGRSEKYPRTRMKFRIQKAIEVELIDEGTCVSISATSDSPALTADAVHSILEAISIAIGRPVACIFSYFAGPAGYTRSINRFDFRSGQRSLPRLIHEEDAKSFKDFVSRYLTLRREDRVKYFSYWENLSDAWPAGLAVSALPLSVYIEGIVNELFSDHVRADAEMVEAVRAAKIAIDELVMEKTTRDRLKGALGSIGRGTASEALGNLAEEGWFDKKCVRIWKQVRNKSAHAVDFNRLREHDEVQEIFTGVYTCLHIFYRTLIILAGFRGFARDFSIVGFPAKFVDARPKRGRAVTARATTS